MFSKEEFSAIIASLVRFSFLIELTNLSVGSTKMKTRWLPGKIKMPQPDSFEPIDGTFEPGNDPRSATFEECVRVSLEPATSSAIKLTKISLSESCSKTLEQTGVFPMNSR